MRKLWRTALALAFILAALTAAAAEEMEVRLTRTGEQARVPTVIPDLKPNETASLPGYGDITVVNWGWYDSLLYCRDGEFGRYESGTSTEYLAFDIAIFNSSVVSRNYLQECEITAVYDDIYFFSGWRYQLDYGVLETYDEVTRIHPECDAAIDPLFEGHYLCGVTLPNAVMESEAPLKVVLTLDDNEVTFYVRGSAPEPAAAPEPTPAPISAPEVRVIKENDGGKYATIGWNHQEGVEKYFIRKVLPDDTEQPLKELWASVGDQTSLNLSVWAYGAHRIRVYAMPENGAEADMLFGECVVEKRFSPPVETSEEVSPLALDSDFLSFGMWGTNANTAGESVFDTLFFAAPDPDCPIALEAVSWTDDIGYSDGPYSFDFPERDRTAFFAGIDPGWDPNYPSLALIALPDDPGIAGVQEILLSIGGYGAKFVVELEYCGGYSNGTGWDAHYESYEVWEQRPGPG